MKGHNDHPQNERCDRLAVNAAKTGSKEKDVFFEKESKKYKDSEQFKQWIKNQPQQLEQFRMIALEQQLIENLEKALKSKDKVIKFSELANKQ